MFRTAVVAALIAFALYGAREERVLERAGLFGSCTPIQTLADDSQWLACSPGYLTGFPDLRTDACTYATARDDVELWHCPARVVASRTAAAEPSP